ncbi:hypothetical protein BGZ72_004217 [Mortierella alpina]|nr:hypothetical protein BGZ72_004217 [Mortierella alpina]
MMASTPLPLTPCKDLYSFASRRAYPSPSLSPTTTYQDVLGSPSGDRLPKPSLMSLADTPASPASPLDALVLALEVAEEMSRFQEQEWHPRPEATFEKNDSEEDPNATVPSSPTIFMAKAEAASPLMSLHQLPALTLPEPSVPAYQPLLTVPALSSSFTPSSLTPSTHPNKSVDFQSTDHRRASVSSQSSVGSISSASSGAERSKTFACTLASCQKKFYQVAHLRIHER